MLQQHLIHTCGGISLLANPNFLDVADRRKGPLESLKSDSVFFHRRCPGAHSRDHLVFLEMVSSADNLAVWILENARKECRSMKDSAPLLPIAVQ